MQLGRNVLILFLFSRGFILEKSNVEILYKIYLRGINHFGYILEIDCQENVTLIFTKHWISSINGQSQMLLFKWVLKQKNSDNHESFHQKSLMTPHKILAHRSSFVSIFSVSNWLIMFSCLCPLARYNYGLQQKIKRENIHSSWKPLKGWLTKHSLS